LTSYAFEARRLEIMAVLDATARSKAPDAYSEAMRQRVAAADPAELVERHGLASIGDSGELEAMVDEVIAENPAFVEQFRSGKDGVINALVGQVMKRSQGRADARQVQELLRSKL
jgi:aspartyl-tRNA(Asn)/glutamyl-tRNA(Gln) amidotransferase subunit B